MDSSYIVVAVTVANREEAEKIARYLLDEKMIACANIISSVSSLFYWSGKIEKADEHLLLMKSRQDLFEKLSESVRALHSYEVPEIIVLPIVRGLATYLEWLDENLNPATE